VIIISLLLISCSDDPSSIGSGQLDQDLINIKVLDSKTDTINQSSTFKKKVISLGTGQTLLVGKSDNLEASSLIKFLILLPDSVKTDFLANNITIDTAMVELTKQYNFGGSNLNFTAHKIITSWSAATFSADSLSSLMYDPADVIINRPVKDDDSLYSFQLDKQLVASWFRENADSTQPDVYGIYLKPDPSSDKITGFQALAVENEEIPVIKIVISKTGSYKDTLTFISSTDVSVVTGNEPVTSPQNIIVQAGLSVQSKLYFDLSVLPVNAIVSSAELFLTVDTVETKTGSSFTNSLAAFFIIDSTNADSTSGSITLSRSGNTFSGNITVFVKRWIDTNTNQGILLTAADQFNGVEKFVIKGSNAAVEEKPRLKIIYTSIR
jgi:hypothetical protein